MFLIISFAHISSDLDYDLGLYCERLDDIHNKDFCDSMTPKIFRNCRYMNQQLKDFIFAYSICKSSLNTGHMNLKIAIIKFCLERAYLIQHKE